MIVLIIMNSLIAFHNIAEANVGNAATLDTTGTSGNLEVKRVKPLRILWHCDSTGFCDEP
jgi:hypothetical protein